MKGSFILLCLGIQVGLSAGRRFRGRSEGSTGTGAGLQREGPAGWPGSWWMNASLAAVTAVSGRTRPTWGSWGGVWGPLRCRAE